MLKPVRNVVLDALKDVLINELWNDQFPIALTSYHSGRSSKIERGVDNIGRPVWRITLKESLRVSGVRLFEHKDVFEEFESAVKECEKFTQVDISNFRFECA